MSTKIKFPKQTEIVEVIEMGVEDAPGVSFEFWKNPSKSVVKSIFDVIMASAEDLSGLSKLAMDKVEHDYYSAICELIVDCNLESLDFSSPKAAMESFDAPDIPMGFVHQVVAAYMSRLLQFNDSVKKALALYVVGSVSGIVSAKKEEK